MCRKMRTAILSYLKLNSLSSTRNVKSPSNCIRYNCQKFPSRTRIKSTYRRCFEEKGVFKNFAKFTRKNVPKSFFNKETLALVFSCQFCEVFKNVLQNLSGRLLQEYVLNLIESQGSRLSG